MYTITDVCSSVEDTEKDGTGGSKGRTSPDHMTPRGGGSSTIKKIKEVLLLRQTKGGKNEVIVSPHGVMLMVCFNSYYFIGS